jgi:hypothetical protein
MPRFEYRCFHCKALFTDEILAQQHFGNHTDTLPLCLAMAQNGSGGGLHDAYIRLRKTFLLDLDDAFCDLGQLVNGWKNTTPATEWSEWDEATRQKMTAVHRRVYEMRQALEARKR